MNFSHGFHQNGFANPHHPYNSHNQHENRTLRATVPPFVPTGNEMQPFTPRYVPPQGNSFTMNDSQSMTEYVAYSRMSHLRDITRVEQQAMQTRQEVHTMKSAMSNDFKTLESQLIQLQFQVQQQANEHRQQFDARKELDEQDYKPTADMRKKYSVSALTKIYLEEAKTFESMARRLRDEVAGLNPTDCNEAQLNPNKAVAPPGDERNDMGADDDSKSKCKVMAGELSIVDPLSTVSMSNWKPFGVTQMCASKYAAPKEHTETFSWDLLQLTLGGKQWCSGFYWTVEQPHLPGRSYWVLEGEYEPFVPQKPGQHGAKVTAVFNPTAGDDNPSLEDFINVPVFICAKGQEEYTYFGTYSQTRYSDRISYDTLFTAIPEHVLRYWAGQLADKKRPSWVTKELRDHFWPQPNYDGPMPINHRVESVEGDDTVEDSCDGVDRNVLEALRAHAEVLREWDQDSLLKVGLLTEDAIMAAFKATDLDSEPGLRLWWEYLECTGYDSKLYDMLTNAKKGGQVNAVAPAVFTTPATVTQEHTTANQTIKVKEEKELDVKGENTPISATVPGSGKIAGDLKLARQMHDGFTKRLPPHARK